MDITYAHIEYVGSVRQPGNDHIKFISIINLHHTHT
jgi:hypothetical protein